MRVRLGVGLRPVSADWTRSHRPNPPKRRRGPSRVAGGGQRGDSAGAARGRRRGAARARDGGAGGMDPRRWGTPPRDVELLRRPGDLEAEALLDTDFLGMPPAPAHARRAQSRRAPSTPRASAPPHTHPAPPSVAGGACSSTRHARARARAGRRWGAGTEFERRARAVPPAFDDPRRTPALALPTSSCLPLNVRGNHPTNTGPVFFARSWQFCSTSRQDAGRNGQHRPRRGPQEGVHRGEAHARSQAGQPEGGACRGVPARARPACARAELSACAQARRALLPRRACARAHAGRALRRRATGESFPTARTQCVPARPRAARAGLGSPARSSPHEAARRCGSRSLRAAKGDQPERPLAGRHAGCCCRQARGARGTGSSSFFGCARGGGRWAVLSARVRWSDGGGPLRIVRHLIGGSVCVALCRSSASR